MIATIKDHDSVIQSGSPATAVNTDDLKRQCLRILRCTARTLAASPGGLRFKAGSRDWLEGLPSRQPG